MTIWPEVVTTLIPAWALILAALLTFFLYLLAWYRGRVVVSDYLLALAFGVLPIAVFYAVAWIGYPDARQAVAASRIAYAVLFTSHLAVGVAINLRR